MANNPFNQDNFFTDYGSGMFGMSVSQADYLRRQSLVRDRGAFHNDILQNDPRAQMAAAMWEHNMGGGFSPEGRARTRLTAGAMINSRMMSQVFGGSRLDMFSGMASGLANAGVMRLNVDGQPQQVFGPGGVTNIMARQMMRQVEDQMFNEQGGARLHRTHGLNRSELGVVMGYMGTRGMLGGSSQTYEVGTTKAMLEDKLEASSDPFEKEQLARILKDEGGTLFDKGGALTSRQQVVGGITGTSTTYDTGRSRRDLELRRDAARDPFEKEQLDRILEDEDGTLFKDGKLTSRQQVVTVSEADRKRVADDVEDVAKTLGMIKGIMGDIGTSGLLQALDALSSGQGKQGMQAAQNRLRNFKVAEMAGGGRADALLGAHVQMSQTYQQLGMSRHMAMSAADRSIEAVTTSRQSNQDWVNQMADKGIYVTNPTDMLAQTMVADTLALDAENPELAAALFAVQQDRSFSDKEREDFNLQARKIGRTGSIEEMQRASANFAASVEAKTGVGISEWNRRAGGDPLSRLQGAQAATHLGVGQEEMQGRMMRQLSRDMGVGGEAAAALASEFSRSSLTSFKGGGAIGTMLDEMGIEGGDQAGFVRELVGVLGEAKYSPLISAEEQRAAAERELEAMDIASALGADSKTSSSIIDGLLGAESISNNMVAEALYNQGEGAEGELLGELNTEVDPVERRRLLREAQTKGHVYKDKDGQYLLYDNAQMKEKREELEDELKKKRADALGVDVDDLEDADKVSSAMTERFDELLKDGNIKGLQELTDASTGTDRQAFVTKLDAELKDARAKAEGTRWKDGRGKDKYEDRMKTVGELEGIREQMVTDIPFDPATAVERIVRLLESIDSGASK